MIEHLAVIFLELHLSLGDNNLVHHRFFLEKLRVQGLPFDEHTFAALDDFCRQPVKIRDQAYEERKRFLEAYAFAREQAKQGHER